MPFLGNTPANTFVSIAKQTITGNGGTSYALSYAVTSANDIDVFYNNVRQEPGVAYTATGTTITFTEAIASTDSVYVLYNGQAIGTINPPTGSVGPSALDRAYLESAGGTISGQLSVDDSIQIQQDSASNNRLTLRGKPSSSYRWGIDNFGTTNTLRFFRENDSDASAGVIMAQIDNIGRFSIPNQPAFYAYNGAQQNPGSVYTVQFTIAALNVGSHYNTSNYRFTAPITGKYVFTFSAMSNGGYNRYALFVNNTMYSDQRFSTNSGYENFGSTWIISLSPGDYVEIKNDISSNSQGDIHADYRNFGGYLLG